MSFAPWVKDAAAYVVLVVLAVSGLLWLHIGWGEAQKRGWARATAALFGIFGLSAVGFGIYGLRHPSPSKPAHSQEAKSPQYSLQAEGRGSSITFQGGKMYGVAPGLAEATNGAKVQFNDFDVYSGPEGLAALQIPAPDGSLKTLSNRVLKERLHQTAEGLRKFQQRVHDNMAAMIDQPLNVLPTANKAQQDAAFEAKTKRLTAQMYKDMAEYQATYWLTAKELVAEGVSRSPEAKKVLDERKDEGRVALVQGKLVGMYPAAKVADILDQVAAALQD
jgi:hypothetical protein